MIRPVFLTAIMTGVFCAGFAVFIHWATEMLERGQIIGFSFVSGFLGSLIAQTVLVRWKDWRK
jgi:hypothetical protein